MTTFLDQRSRANTLLYSTENKIKIEVYYCRGVNTLLYSTENKIKIEGYYYCRGVLSGAAMAPPALHLRENTSRRQRRCHDPLWRTIGGLDQQRANGSQYDADPHLQLYSCRIASSCSIRSQVVCETEAQPRQTNTTPVPTVMILKKNTLFKISTGSLVLKLLCTGGQFLS